MDIKVMIDGMYIILMDDLLNPFAGIGLDIMYIDVRMSSDRNQSITIFGKGLDGDVLGKSSSKTITASKVCPLLKKTQNSEIYVSYKDNYWAYQNSLQRDASKIPPPSSTAQKLIKFAQIMESESDANFFVQVLQKANGTGQFIKVTLKQIVVNALMPVWTNILKVVAMAPEMSINRMIKPVARTTWGPYNLSVVLVQVFVFIHPPETNTFNKALILQIPEMSYFSGIEWKDKTAMKEKELVNYFTDREFQEPLYKELTEQNPSELIQVSQSAIALGDVDMNLVPLSNMTEFISGRMSNTGNTDTNKICRNVMQPTFVATQSRNYKFQDSYSEMNFNRGVTKIGEIKILGNVELLNYLKTWYNEANMKSISSMTIKGVYEAHLRTIIDKAQVSKRPKTTKITRSSSDLFFNGLQLGLLDDVYETNLPMLNISIQPINAYQTTNKDFSGYRDLNITIDGSIFNYNSLDWEPIFENFTLILDYFTVVEQEQQKTITNISFGDKNPSINLTTELYILATSIAQKMSPSQTKNVKINPNITMALGNYIKTKVPSYVETYDDLTILSPENFAKFIGKFTQEQQVQNSFSMYENLAATGQQRSQAILKSMDFKQEISLKLKNPLNFRYNDPRSNEEYSFQEGDNQGPRRLINRTNPQFINSSKKGPIHVEYNQRNFNTTLSKSDILQIIQQSDGEGKYSSDDILQREVPFRIENLTGRHILFHLRFFDFTKNLFVKNMEAKNMAYPFSYENYMLKLGKVTSRSEKLSYRIYEVDDQCNTFSLIEDKDLHSIRKQHLRYANKNYGEGFIENQDPRIKDLQYLIMDTTPLIMKKNILLKSPVQIYNHCDHKVQLHFYRKLVNGGQMLVYTLQTVTKTLEPVPVDCIDCNVEVKVLNVGEVADSKTQKSLCELIFDTYQDGVERKYDFNCRFEVNLMPVKQEDGTWIIHLSPPLVLRNLFLTELRVSLATEAHGREYSDTFNVSCQQNLLPEHIPLLGGSFIKFKVQISHYESEVVELVVEKARNKEKEEYFWLFQSGKKKIRLCYNLFYKYGTFTLSFFSAHLIYDELFKNLALRQTGERFNDILPPLSRLQATSLRGSISKSVVFQESLLTANYIFDNAVDADTMRSTVYMLPFPGDTFHIADQRDQYQLASVQSSPSATGRTYTVQSISSKTNVVEVYDIVAINEVFTLSNEPNIVITKTHLKHKYLIKNSCGHAIQVKQLKFKDSVEMTIENEEILPVRFSPSDKNKDKRIVNFGIAGYDWSDKIKLNSLNLHYFMLRTKGGKLVDIPGYEFKLEEFITLSIEVSNQDDSHLVTIRRETEKGSFNLVNNLDDMIVFLSHDPEKLKKKIAEVCLYANTGNAHYSWPTSEKQTKDLFMTIINIKTETESPVIKVEYSEQTFSYDLLGTRIYHQAEMIGGSLLCTFSFFPKTFGDRNIKSEINLNVPFLGLSMIGGQRENRRELLFASFTDLQVKAEFYEKMKKFKVQIRYFNIDNNSEYLSYYPIFFSPKFSYENLVSRGYHHIDFYAAILNKADANDKMTIIKKVDLKMIGNILKIEESFIHSAFSALDSTVKEINISKAFMQKQQVREVEIDPDLNKDYRDALIQASQNNYRKMEMQSVQPATTYINSLLISDFDLALSFKRERGDESMAALNKYSKYIQKYGFLLFSIEDLNLYFNPFILQNNIYPLQTVKNEVIRQYRNDAIRTGLTSMLDLNLLGNPSKIARELKLGVDDLVNKPSERAEQYNNSVYGLTKGVAEGTKSMAKHTAMGTLGAVGTITGTLANMTSNLSLDTRYMRERNRMRSAQANRDMNTMTQGLKHLGFSLKDSVAGLFTKPAEMAEKEDIWGAIKGSFIGVGGLVTKPITGLLDFTSTLAHGARNGLDTEKLQPSTMRVRNPRAFYGKTSLIK